MNKLVKSALTSRILVVLLLFVSMFVGTSLTSPITFAHEDAMCIPPDFPTCESKIFTASGDHDHSENGNFYIIGVGWRQGTDDVYRLMDGNFLQCYCPTNGGTGIQSDWWNASLEGLTPEEINKYKSEGWFEEQGSQRNLPNYTFLVHNREFNCNAPTPTVTPVPTAVPTMTPTSIPQATATPGPQGPISRCFDLTADHTSGNASLTVNFTGHADDPSQAGKIKEYRFDFADASDNQQQVVYTTNNTASHRYTLPGTYEAILRIQDYAGNWRESDDCKLKIQVNPAGQVLGITSPDQLPATGASLFVLAVALPLYFFGKFLYRKFKLV